MSRTLDIIILSSLCGECSTIAGNSTVIFRKQNSLIGMDRVQNLQRETTWGLFATKDEA